MNCFAQSDRGTVRKENQDRAACAHIRRKGCTVAVVCDGMGGTNGGNIASVLARDTFCSQIQTFFRQLRLAGKQPQRVVRGNRRFVRALPQRPARELFVQDACPAVPFDQPECLGRGKSDLAEAYGVSVFVLDVCARIAGREQLADRPVSEVVNDGGSALSESVHR